MSYGYEIIFGVNWKCDFKKHLASLCQGDPPRSVLKTATGNRSDHHRSVINIRVIKLSSANKRVFKGGLISESFSLSKNVANHYRIAILNLFCSFR